MSRWRLVLLSLRHRRRAALGVTLGFALSAAVLVGALLVGDSVRGSLAQRARAGIGRVAVAWDGGERRVRAQLADELQAELGGIVAPALRLDATASAAGGARRANEVSLLGIDARFLALAPGPSSLSPPAAGEVLLSERLGSQLAVAPGDEVLLRVEAPSVLSRDMLLATADEASIGLRVRVAAVLSDADFGRFTLAAAPLAPFNAFVDLGWLQAELEFGPHVNTLLVDDEGQDPVARAAAADVALRAQWQLEDAQLELIELDETGAGSVELRTPRVFLEESVLEVASRFPTQVVGVLTYFVNALAAGDRETPYSMVTAVGTIGSAPPPALGQLVPTNLGDDEIVINAWLAEDLGIGVGDELRLRYFVPGPDRALAEEERALRVRAVTPLEGLAADPEWMPDFPGISDSEHCRDWESGVPVDYDAVRDEDEAYWDEFGGTPKAFVSLPVGQAMWSNPWGALTSIRFSGIDRATAAASLRAGLDPAELGLFFTDVRTQALAGGATATDFGGLFLGLSFFLIAAALSLTALLFAFGVDQRSAEIGTLLATGFRPRDVRRLFLLEATLLALVGAALGAAAGTIYTKLVLRGLASVWSGAVASSAIEYHARPATFAIGAGATVIAALGASWLALRRASKRSALDLLRSRAGVAAAPRRKPRMSVLVALVALIGAGALGWFGGGGSAQAAAGSFFGAGALLLISGLALARVAILRAGAGEVARSVGGLGLANAARRPGRSLAVVGLFAAGTFLVLSIGVHRKRGEADALERGAGTGGFALFGRSALPLYEHPGSEAGREAYGLDDGQLDEVSIVPLRVRPGDDASCLNLGSPQRPQLVGVDPSELAQRGAFRFAATLDDPGDENPWLLLERELPDGAVPAVADSSSAKWTMKKALGESFEYEDGRGEPFQVRLVALVEDSILQGNLVISSADFRARFPADSGTNLFLVDAPPERAEEVAADLSRALQDEGLELTSAAQRLDEFNAVQNAYLDVFQVLGGLGLLLGSAGLGLVVLRNALERRAELALLRAVGWSRAALRRVLVAEHLLLFALGLGVGVLAALLAVLPAQAGASLASAAPLVAAIAVNGALWVLVASALAARGDLIEGLRSE